MKKIRYFFVLILLFLVTGCSNYNVNMKVNKNKSMEISLTILSNDNTKIEEGILKYENTLIDYGYSIERYNLDNKSVVVISKYFDNIDDVSNAKSDEEFNLLYMYNNDYDVESKMFNVSKKFISNRYIANFYVDLTELDIDLQNTEISYSVQLPYEPESSNTNIISTDRKTLTWNIKSLNKTEIDYVFVLNNYDYIYYIIAILIVIYLLILIVSALLRKSGDNNEVIEESNDVNDNNSLKKNDYIIEDNVNSYNTKNIDRKDPSSIGLTPWTEEKKMEIKDDISSFHMPVKENKPNLFNVNLNRGQDIIPNKKNDNNDFNSLVNNFELKSSNNNVNGINLNNSNVNVSSNNVNSGVNLKSFNDFNNEIKNDKINIPTQEVIESNSNLVNEVKSENDSFDSPVINLNNKSIFLNNENKDE